MSNRRRPRAVLSDYLLTDDIDAGIAAVSTWRCPDCSSVLSAPVRRSDDHVVIEVAHDSSCPWLRARAGQGR